MGKTRNLGAKGWAALALAIALTSCTSDLATNSESGGYISADGSITVVPPADREPAPDFAGETLEGADISLGDVIDNSAGDVVVVNVWGSWCGPCHAEAADLAEAAKRLAPQGVSFLGIDIRDQTASALAFQKEYGIDYPSIYDPDSSTLLDLPESMMAVSPPTTYVVDSEGRLAARVFAEVTVETLVDLVDEVRGSGG
ncbi:MAG TPA: TlpA disulfide reductase family protein [Nocardioidaceae bacterium]|nr:TlpA disulfide reductase family protein [Nocardioidaceae bacterium]